MSQELIHQNLSEAIIGAAMKVLNTLKPGLDEKLYERALVVRFASSSLYAAKGCPV
jgi:GxxExxY protein